MSICTTEIEKNLEKQLEANRQLHLAIKTYDIKLLNLALANGAQVNSPVVFKNGIVSNRLPLQHAVYLQNLEVLKTLIHKGADTKILIGGFPLFLKAVEIGNHSIVSELLLIDKQNINVFHSMTPLSMAILSISTFLFCIIPEKCWVRCTHV
jgi:hypothetical protein